VQPVGAGAVQTLLMLQVDTPVKLEPVHVAPPHWVPDGYFWQAPLPLQRPLVPQVVEPWFAHWVVGFGAWPPGIDVQVPTVPERLQEVQVPAQALLQQTVCAQKPELHMAAAVHGWPIASLPQVPVVCPVGIVQEAGVVQSVPAVQVVLQAPPVPQAYGSHNVEVTVLQVPAPSQVRKGVSVSPTQVAPAH
jgi:hypothetical protein